MNECTFYNIKFSSDDEGNIKVVNQTTNTLKIFFANERIKFNGYVNTNFTSGMWVSTNLKNWEYGSDANEVKIKILSSEHKYEVMYNTESKTFVDKTDKYINVSNYKVTDKKISILIAAHNARKHIDETLNSFIKILKDKEYIKAEIIILIDGCKDTLKHISDKVYPDNIKVYLSTENHGLSITKNTLVKLCSNEKFIFFDSDDIPTENLINSVYDSLNKNDIVYYNFYEFIDGKNYEDKKNLKEINEGYMGGTFGMKKSKFLEMNGFFPWRVQSDDEFKLRTTYSKNLKRKVINEKLFKYRIRKDSLSRNKNTKRGSILRDCYIEVINEKINEKEFLNPVDLKYNKNVILIQ